MSLACAGAGAATLDAATFNAVFAANTRWSTSGLMLTGETAPSSTSYDISSPT